jgi:hypothetical protein
VDQIKRIETLINVYQSMDEQRRGKMEQIAKGLLNVQMLTDGRTNVRNEKENPGGKKTFFRE